MNKAYITLLLIFIALVSRAQDSTIVFSDTLETVDIISPFVAVKKSPFTYKNLDISVISQQNYGQEASFILSNTPSITVYSDAGSYQGYSYFRMRGIDQTRINMTLDGVPLNEPEDQGVYFSNYPDFFNSVGSIQIQRGVGTSKNGAASYGGSIQFGSPTLTDEAKKEFGVGYGSFNNYRAYAEYNSGLINNKALYIRGSYLHSDGYKERSANTSRSIFYSGGIFNKKNTWKLTSFMGRQKNQMAWLGSTKEILDQNPKVNANSPNEDDEFMQSLFQLQHINYISDRSTLTASTYYNRLTGNYDFDLNNFLGAPSTDELYNYALKSHFYGAFSNYTYETPQLKFVAGIHANRYTREHIGSEQTSGHLYTNKGTKGEFSLFAKGNYQLGKFVIFADVQWRNTYFDYHGDVALERFKWDFLNPKAGITLEASDQLNIYYSIGKTSREPTRTDIFIGSDNLNSDHDGNPILGITTPEEVVDHELGLRHQTGKLNWSANLYYMDFKNEIVLNGQFGPNGLALNDHVSKSFRSGLEVDVNYTLAKRLTINQNLSYNRSRIEEGGITFQPILTPSFISNSRLSYPIKSFRISLEGRYQSNSYLDFANEEELAGYFLVNSQLSYQYKLLTASIFLNNITNQKYYNNGYVDFDGSAKYFIQAPLNIFTNLVISF